MAMLCGLVGHHHRHSTQGPLTRQDSLVRSSSGLHVLLEMLPILAQVLQGHLAPYFMAPPGKRSRHLRHPEIWRLENLTEIPSTFMSTINDCMIDNKVMVIVKGLDEWPNEFQRQYETIDLYWIVRDGGLMLLLSQLLLTKPAFENYKIQVFYILEEDTDAAELKTDVKKFLYDLRMHAEVIVVTMKSCESHVESSSSGAQPDDSQEAYTSAQQRVDKFLFTMFKLNSTILRHSRMAAMLLVRLPPPPLNHPAYFYMEYMDLLVENVPRMLTVRRYRRDVVRFFT
ncbi:cation-chloride cotransporter 1-like [Triticum aestivum]|uniref:cation-chloride cotransporter 1-like n=1 Tax=Triticum aestivum TaxID=4565 RepID=UPI001D00D02A|nr:cation-chloride cotransporter 1-like [Triticum aestivum]